MDHFRLFGLTQLSLAVVRIQGLFATQYKLMLSYIHRQTNNLAVLDLHVLRWTLQTPQECGILGQMCVHIVGYNLPDFDQNRYAMNAGPRTEHLPFLIECARLFNK